MESNEQMRKGEGGGEEGGHTSNSRGPLSQVATATSKRFVLEEKSHQHL